MGTLKKTRRRVAKTVASFFANGIESNLFQPIELFRQRGSKIDAPVLGNGDNVLDSDSPDGFSIEPGLDGDDVADDEFGASEIG